MKKSAIGMTLIALMAVFLTAQSTPAYYFPEIDWRIALVIGNGDYELSPIPHAMNDAQDITTRLKECNFTVTKLINASRNSMIEKINEFEKKMKKGKVGLFFYAGHGIQFNGENYLVPPGAAVKNEANIANECIKLSDILKIMAHSENETNIVLIDASYDKPYGYDFIPKKRGLTNIDVPPRFMVSFSTTTNSVTDKMASKNGVYTAKLLKHMLNQEFEIEKFFKIVRSEVVDETHAAQVPWEASTLIDDFYFNPPRTFFKMKIRKKKAFGSSKEESE